MNAVLLIAKKEIQIALRKKLIAALAIVIMGLLSIALYTGYVAYNQQRAIIEQAKQENRTEWLEQGDKHPHIAAHYGTFVFKPKTILSLFDFGLDTYTGTSVYLEAHYQHEFMFRPAQDHSSMIRFGELSAAMVFQILIPLLIIFLAFTAFTEERENGTLKLLISQGVSYSSIIKGKIIAYVSILFAIVIPFFVIAFILSTVITDSGSIPDVGLRVLFLLIVYAIYLSIFVAFSVWVSMQSSTGRNALLTLLTCWILFTIIIPKTTANFGESFYPLPSMKIYREAIQKDIRNGLDGKNPKIAREQQLKKEYLQHYKVDSIHKLPLNFEGIRMQAGEDYGNKVYDVHWERLIDIFNHQNRISSLSSFITPYLAVRNISMGLAATDLNTSIHFQKVTENYRRELVRKMNLDMAQNSKYGEFYEYKADKNLWKTVKDFHYKTMSAYEILSQYLIELLSLCCWGLVIFFLLNYSSHKKKPVL
ncbi:ABC-2 type transport system permease protein [Aquimarina sp. EL_43]|uniref:ABC transporter permease n=1 Tax=unclassified Aquimarina TaxID=2627091 RepID=UPI0018C8F0E1|nr:MULTISPECIES: DUF3526 domain-containing protein [unclassified Aquimarina]MBG6130996.1 ABC-2 type transport system permease protein [Aquimarina sp. EL_35]MBG6151455.1 ABC-2 type transport system permease protein [Aquimarina sp. EL_32]MBG6169386.1 ABC-2 type transport system permease protein [Aquimarina sp. EL_43]